MADLAIRTEGLTQRFGPVLALDQLSLEVPKGVVFGFLGPNGSGKTTTIRLLLGLLEPSGGRAEVLGFDTRTQSEEIRSRTGALLEHHGLYERLSAEDNLDLYGRIWHLPVDRRRDRIQELLRHMGLWDRRREVVGNWSRGMKQKLAVARAMLARPPLIFLDEPTAGLDPVAAAALREELAALVAREGVTVFLTTHNLVEAEKLCSQVGVLRQGQLLAVGHPDELRRGSGGPQLEVLGRRLDGLVPTLLKARPEVASVEGEDTRLLIKLIGPLEAAPLVKLIVEAGGEIEEVRRGKPSLEEAFLALVEEER
ncbi:MAG: ATP-binding cassette domain-containing protein [Chloroflexota bacterium]